MKTSIWTYPWDMVDGGPRKVADRIAETGLTAISLTATYHCFDELRPHGTGSRFLTVTESAAYYPCRPALFDHPLVPKRSDLIGPEDWTACVSAARSAGLDLVAWTLFLHNSTLAGNCPQMAQQTCIGERLRHQLCPANADVRQYVRNLATDICSTGVDVLECESMSYGGFGHTHYHPKIGVDLGAGGRYLISLCFCDACELGARSAGVDVDAVRSYASREVEQIFATGDPLTVTPEELTDRDDGLRAFATFRDEVVTSLTQEVAAAAGKPIRLLAMGDRYTSALDIPAIAEHVDAVEYLCYTPDADRIRTTISSAAAQTGSTGKIGVGLQAYPPASPDMATLSRTVETTRRSDVGLISFYNYGIMPEQNLSWISHSLSCET